VAKSKTLLTLNRHTEKSEEGAAMTVRVMESQMRKTSEKIKEFEQGEHD